jgi:hypothetical protein
VKCQRSSPGVQKTMDENRRLFERIVHA